MAVCSEIHTKHINTAVWAERRVVNVKPVVHIVTAGPESDSFHLQLPVTASHTLRSVRSVSKHSCKH